MVSTLIITGYTMWLYSEFVLTIKSSAMVSYEKIFTTQQALLASQDYFGSPVCVGGEGVYVYHQNAKVHIVLEVHELETH